MQSAMQQSVQRLKRHSISDLISKISSLRRRMSTPSGDELLAAASQCVPELDGNKHKGQAGRIGVVGGSLEYTGAPYFAGISALKVGADLVHVFCTQSAGPVIKSYSPELIVHPLLDAADAITEISPWLSRLDAVVIGPGLGRQARTLQTAADIIEACRKRSVPLVIDADGLYLITQNRDLIRDYPSPGVILTPNKNEFQRLFPEESGSTDGVSEGYGANVSILRKGKSDEFLNSSLQTEWSCDIGGSGRRCGGQGDLLSGTIAVFMNWALVKFPAKEAAKISCYAASRLVRLCNGKAFQRKGRSMLASDMIDDIHEAFEQLYEQ